ncbi:MAG TPA: hypothetical protein PLF82_10380 [Halanaerobiales bacterium]|nr:hypothetical protein [Halanaerobiales bacterium]
MVKEKECHYSTRERIPGIFVLIRLQNSFICVEFAGEIANKVEL